MPGARAARALGPARQVLPPLVLLVALVAAWHAVVVLGEVPAFVLPGPAAIAEQAVTYAGPISSAALVTGRNAALGLLLGAVLGVLGAVVAAVVRLVDLLAEPVVAALSVVPVVALAPVLYAMYGAGSEQARVIVAALAVLVPVHVTTLRGLRQVRPVHRDLMRALAAGPVQAAATVTLPTAVPFVFTGLRMAASLAVISAIVAEYFGGPRSGIGSFITTAAAGSHYAQAWAYVLGGVAVGLAFYAVTATAEHLVNRRAGA
ncbi:ABC transporter permease subunit [Cellulomonas sp. zg-ZUI222]|uniref:ABC transporter permease subunit n=1 Tax=Cellulomonas wangleii TaxID=2816956 RepID=A0ABX8D9P5_9CELL|nr:ABC transporter permease subunit [Cellulomonas sp. zg-ZUI22]MBO0921437.1 ABC transporter permease subunit [Cellulomonas wangleii]MBO0925854.1 ABC transporter permease subunit [Cellulomonas wangleii]QVI64155.1 ABC transporter permease subunit [Cellulomonas wangleii]